MDCLIRLVDDNLKAMRGEHHDGRAFRRLNPDDYKEECRVKYGAKYDECKRKTSKYTNKDWEDMKAESGTIMNRIMALMDKGPNDPEVKKRFQLTGRI